MKIGFTVDPSRRQQQIKRWHGSHTFRLHWVAYSDDAADAERLLKDLTKDYRFGPSEEILAITPVIIRRLMRQAGLKPERYHKHKHVNTSKDF